MFRILLFYFLIAVPVSVYAEPIGTPSIHDPDPAELTKLINPETRLIGSEAEVAREVSVKDEAMIIGATGGFEFQCKQILVNVERRAAELSRIYNFQPLLSREGLMMPVIEEGRDQLSVDVDYIETSSSVYRIVRPARFVRIAPTYRDYLLAGLDCEKNTNTSSRPLSYRLREVSTSAWEEGVRLGWNAGILRAQVTFTDNLSRINREYLGMLKFRRLEMIGAVKMPVIESTETISRLSEDKIETGVRQSAITSKSKFVTDVHLWRPEVGK